jgi:hypothetical protein
MTTTTREGPCPLEGIHIFTTGPVGRDCASRAQALLTIRPSYRALIGTVLLQGAHDLRSGQPATWAKPWDHHIWLVDPDGGLIDPSRDNLLSWAEQVDIALPCPPDEMRVEVLNTHQQHRALLSAYVSISSGPPADLFYLPGLVFSSSVEEMPASPEYVSAWGKLAGECQKAGGWDLHQLEEGLGRVDALLAAPPNLRRLDVNRAGQPNRKAGRTAARGFGA